MSKSYNEERDQPQLDQPGETPFQEADANDHSNMADTDDDSNDDEKYYLDDDSDLDYVPESFVAMYDFPTIPVLGRDGKFHFECTVCFEEHVTDNGMIRCEDFFGEGSSVEYHMVCVGCIQKWAAAAVGEAALAPGGVGLRCVDNACRNVILTRQFEKYLSQNVCRPLAERLQNECTAAAGLSNFLTCSRCMVKGTCSETPEEKCSWMECSCGFVQCLNCNLAAHEGKTCSEVLEKMAIRAKTIDEIVIRKCDHCQAEFIKDGGCNKITCRCGKNYCYVCNQEISRGDNHFCSCLSVSGNFNDGTGRCTQCNKTCGQLEDPQKRDLQKINELTLDDLYTP